MESTLVGLIVSALVPKLLELLKSQRWAGFIAPYTPRLNRLTAIVVSTLTTIGVTVRFDAGAGELVIGGLLPGQILSLVVTWIVNFAIQEAVYRKFINQDPDQFVGRRGFTVIPIVLALGAGSACAKVAPIAIAGEQSVRTAIVLVSEKVEPLVCNPEARKVLTSQPCLQLLDALEPATELAISYNRALAAGHIPDIAATVAAVEKLIAAVRAVIPAGADRDQALVDLALARARAEGGK